MTTPIERPSWAANLGSKWDDCINFNDAIAATLFGPDRGGEPAYLDLEEDAVVLISKAIGIAPEDFTSALVSAVLGVFRLGESNPFAAYERATKSWTTNPVGVPPALALLAVLSMAAEEMGNGGGMAAHNYYGRLLSLFGITDSRLRSRIEAGYRDVAELLWASLNYWLESEEGELGLPTAHVLNAHHRFISLPLSQALLRRADRESLHEFFERSGFSPRERISTAEIEIHLDEWLPSSGSSAPNHLKRIWKISSLRERVAEMVSLYLETWPGTQSKESQAMGRSAAIRLIAVLKTHFVPGLELGLEVSLPPSDEQSEALLVGDRGLALEFSPSANGSHRLAVAGLLDLDSLPGSSLRLTHQLSGTRAERLPRRVVPLRLDDFTQTYVESERVGLAEQFMLLVQTELIYDVASKLERIARPGWRKHDTGLTGLPLGWALFSNVEVLATEPVLSDRIELNCLVPIAATQLQLSGGIQLPGKIRKWLKSSPPELRAVATSASEVTITIKCERPLQGHTPEDWSRTMNGSVIIVDLKEVGLPEGDYSVTFEATDMRPSSTTLRLRSALTPAPGLIEILCHRLDEPETLPLISCAPGGATDGVIGAACSNPGRQLGATPLIQKAPQWPIGASVQRPIALQEQLPQADPKSCLNTGWHVISLPTFYGISYKKSVEGVCASCGLVKRYPATWALLNRSNSKSLKPESRPSEKPHPIDPAKFQPITKQRAEWDEAFEALCHLRQGPNHYLERIALQIDGTLLAADRLQRGLDNLGHLDSQFDLFKLRPNRWCISPPTLVAIDHSSGFLVGSRDARLPEILRELERDGVQISLTPQTAAPSKILLRSDAMPIDEIAQRLGIDLILNAPQKMASALPLLSEIEAELPVRQMPAARAVEVWDPEAARWFPETDSQRPGAFRISGFGITYGFRRLSHVNTGEIVLAPVQLLKHIEARRSGFPLFAYNEETMILSVRLGADLPGLFGRSAVLCSGELPIEDLKTRSLNYLNVSVEVAQHIAFALLN